jgi:hypothetical protein
MKYLADIPLSPNQGFAPPGEGPLSDPSADPGNTFSKIISMTIGVMTAIAFIYFVYRFLSGAISVITAGGDKGKLEDARRNITTGIIGIIIVISAIFLIDFIGELIGVDILNPIAVLTAI